MIERVDHVEVITPNLDQSITFYTNVLGFKLTRRVAYPQTDPSRPRREIAYLALGDLMLEFLSRDTPLPRGDAVQVGVKLVALRVDDMVEPLETLKAHGVEASWGPNPGATFDGVRAEIKDPHGNSIELREWRNGDRPDNGAWHPTRPGMERVE